MALSRRLGIISNRDHNSLKYRLAEQGINLDMFNHVHTPEKGLRKPDPRVFNHFWSVAGFDPKNTIFIGDSIEHDLMAAKSHNPPISFIAITSGLHDMDDFIKAGVKGVHVFASVLDFFQAKYLLA